MIGAEKEPTLLISIPTFIWLWWNLRTFMHQFKVQRKKGEEIEPFLQRAETEFHQYKAEERAEKKGSRASFETLRLKRRIER
jgi:hypothetical protein